MKIFSILFAALLFSLSSFCQTIQVNPDGSHSVIHTTGNISTVVNPDGTHTVIFNNGSTSTQVNSDGSHTNTFHNGSTSTQVNPDGSHTVIFHNGNTSTAVNPDGSHTIVNKINDNLKLVTGSDQYLNNNTDTYNSDRKESENETSCDSEYITNWPLNNNQPDKPLNSGKFIGALVGFHLVTGIVMLGSCFLFLKSM